MLRVLFLNSSGTISANQVENTFADTLSRIMRRQLSHIVFKFGFIKNQSVKFLKGGRLLKLLLLLSRWQSLKLWSGRFRQCKYPKEKAKKQMENLLEN